MKRNIAVALLGIGVVIVLAILAGVAGNVAIRTVQDQGTTVTLQITEPVVLGVDSAIHWKTPAGMTNTLVQLKLRTLSAEKVIGQAKLSDKSAAVRFPCGLNYNQATLELLDQRTGEVLAAASITAFAEGQDCVR